MSAAAILEQLLTRFAGVHAGLALVLADEAQRVAEAAKAEAAADPQLADSIAVAQKDLRAEVGTALDRARVREFGFSGVESVTASVRQVSEVFGRAILPVPAQIAPFARQVDMPARPFLGPALADAAPRLVQGVKQAVREALS